jgi:CHAD domain-containing protein
MSSGQEAGREILVQTMQEYARISLAQLLARVTSELERAADHPDADSVHDVRVAIRRANQAMHVFAGLVPHHAARHVRRRLQTVLEGASAVRDCDIAMELYSEVRLPTSHPAWEDVRAARVMAETDFLQHVRESVLEARSNHWQSQLDLPPP